MKSQPLVKSIRRSIAISTQLAREVSALAPADIRGNFNRVVTVALQEYVARLKERAFEEQMALMACDPSIRAECRTIDSEFQAAESDGLKK